VSPACATAAAPAIVQNGCAGVPGPLTEQEAFVLSTMNTLDASADGLASANAPTAMPASDPMTLARLVTILAVPGDLTPVRVAGLVPVRLVMSAVRRRARLPPARRAPGRSIVNPPK
jgi:hypothetical protein